MTRYTRTCLLNPLHLLSERKLLSATEDEAIKVHSQQQLEHADFTRSGQQPLHERLKNAEAKVSSGEDRVERNEQALARAQSGPECGPNCGQGNPARSPRGGCSARQRTSNGGAAPRFFAARLSLWASLSAVLQQAAATGGQVQFSEEQLLAMNLAMLMTRSAEVPQQSGMQQSESPHQQAQQRKQWTQPTQGADSQSVEAAAASQRRPAALAPFGRADRNVRTRMDSYQTALVSTRLIRVSLDKT